MSEDIPSTTSLDSDILSSWWKSFFFYSSPFIQLEALVYGCCPSTFHSAPQLIMWLSILLVGSGDLTVSLQRALSIQGWTNPVFSSPGPSWWISSRFTGVCHNLSCYSPVGYQPLFIPESDADSSLAKRSQGPLDPYPQSSQPGSQHY